MKPLRARPVSSINLRYSHILRCIGQNLESMDLKAVDLKCQGGTYLVQGWHKGTCSSVDVERRYTPEDVGKLEMEGRARRQRLPGIPNLLSLSQVLRFAGNYVDRLRGRLLRVSWQNQSDKIQSITIQYETHQEDLQEPDEAQISTIDEICIHLYKQRKRIAGTSDKIIHRQSATG